MNPNPNETYSFRQGQVPVLVSFPHSSTFIPESLKSSYSEKGLQVPDTDWELPKLYDIDNPNSPFYNTSIIQAKFSRFVIDPNRSTDGVNLYPGRPTPELCPTKCFDGSAVYLEGQQPDQKEIDRRTDFFWRPYHDQIRKELSRLKEKFGTAVLFDAHSIISIAPRLFEGSLPNFNMGTAEGKSCSESLSSEIAAVLEAQNQFTHVFNGRFIGGHITRSFGDPENQIHAVQLELTQTSYMNEDTGEYCDSKADTVQPVIFQMITAIKNWARKQSANLNEEGC